MKTSLVALLLVLANLASGQTAAPAQPQASQPQASPPQPQTAEEGNQGSRRIQRLCRRRAADGPCCQDQRAGSLPHSVSQQRDERRCAGIADGNLPAGQQPGQGHRHREPAPGSEPGQRARLWCCWPTTSAPPRSGPTPNNTPSAAYRLSTRCPSRTAFPTRISPSRRPSWPDC